MTGSVRWILLPPDSCQRKDMTMKQSEVQGVQGEAETFGQELCLYHKISGGGFKL